MCICMNWVMPASWNDAPVFKEEPYSFASIVQHSEVRLHRSRGYPILTPWVHDNVTRLDVDMERFME